MSWSDLPRVPRSSLAASAVLALVSVGLSGCFSPMYLAAGGNLGAQLRAISVDPVPDSLGHYLRDQLITNLNGTGDSAAPRYRLQLTSSERVQTALIDIVTQRAQDATVVTDITYKLIPIQGGAPLATGTITSAAVYDRSAQRFANIRAARDAEIRDAKTVADQITTQVAAQLGGASPAR